jgi:hypothetical protein
MQQCWRDLPQQTTLTSSCFRHVQSMSERESILDRITVNESRAYSTRDCGVCGGVFATVFFSFDSAKSDDATGNTPHEYVYSWYSERAA